MGCNRLIPGIYIAYVMQGLILMSVVHSITVGKIFLAVTTLLAFILTIVPYLVERSTPICLPWQVNSLIAISMLIHVAGHTGEYYIVFSPYYDKIAHLVSSLTVSTLGFIAILVIDRIKNLRLTTGLIVFSVVIFTMGLSALWEIYEFTFDLFFGMQLQHGLEDTMYDLIINLFGAMIVAIAAGISLWKMTKSKITDRFIRKDSAAACGNSGE